MTSKPAVSKTVVVATYRLSKESIADVAVACERVRFTMVLTNGSVPAEDRSGAVLVAGLSPGERRIPEELLAPLRKRGSGNLLLLLCSEPLVRPSISLYKGRVTLLGADATADAIASRLRVLLADHTPGFGSVASDERAYPCYWSHDAGEWGGGSAQFLENQGAFTFLFPLEAPGDLPMPLLGEVRTLLLNDADRPAELYGALLSAVGTNVGTLHYNTQLGRIRIFWPPSEHTLWLISPSRLPVLSDLSGLGGGPASVQASSGDVLLALSRECGRDAAQVISRELPARASLGGPAVFDVVSEMLKSGSQRWATVTELR